jgi:hypothetical protein
MDSGEHTDDRPLDDILYHYGSNSSFHRLFQDGYMSATHFAYFNDTQEVTYALHLVDGLLDEMLDKEVNPAKRLSLETAKKITPHVADYQVFVYCFSEAGNLLSQWRAYGGTEGGYLVGFGKEDLEKVGKREGFKLVRCIYDINEQKRAVSDLLKVFTDEYPDEKEQVLLAGFQESLSTGKLPEMTDSERADAIEMLRPLQSRDILAPIWEAILPGLKEEISRQEPNEKMKKQLEMLDASEVLPLEMPGGLEALALPDDPLQRELFDRIAQRFQVYAGPLTAFLMALVGIAPKLKHPTFAEEREWRLVSRPQNWDNSKIDFRPGTSMLIPFYRLPLMSEGNHTEVARVYVGPARYPDQAMASAKGFLRRRNISCPSVVYSGIPYREL